MSGVINLSEYSIEFREAWDRKRYCRRCSIPMHRDSLGDYRCVSCGKKELNDYHKIKEYLDHNKVSTENMIEDATGVPAVIIKEFHEHGVIEYTDASSAGKRCSICGKPITKDTVCRACYERSVAGLQSNFLKSSKAKSNISNKSSDEPSENGNTSEKPDLSDPAVRLHAWVRKRK